MALVKEKKKRKTLRASSAGKLDKCTQAVEEKGLSWELVLLQVDVFSGAGILQMLLVVLLEGATEEKTNVRGNILHSKFHNLLTFSCKHK